MSPWKRPNQPETLANLRPGINAAVISVTDQGKETVRLGEMGLCAGAMLEVITNDGSIVVRVGEHRLCLAQDYAQDVTVLPL